MQKIIISVLAGSMLFSGAALAQTSDLPDPGMLPGNPLYFVKTFSEGVGTFFTFGASAKVERYLTLAEKRLAEAKTLAERGDNERAERTLGRYQSRLEEALERAESVGEEDVISRVAEATLRHQQILANVIERVPEEARPAIERAMEMSQMGHERATEALSQNRVPTPSISVEETIPDIPAPTPAPTTQLQRTSVSCTGPLYDTHVHMHSHEFGAPPTPSLFINRMAEHGVSCGVMFMDPKFIENNFAAIRGDLASTGFGVIPFLSAESMAADMSIINELEIKGFGEIALYMGPLKDTSLSNPMLQMMFQAAHQNNMFIMMHPTAVHANELSQVASQYPNAKFLLHGFELVRDVDSNVLPNLLANNSNIYWTYDLSKVIGHPLVTNNSAEAFLGWWSGANKDSLLQRSYGELLPLLEAAPDRVMWGTDVNSDWNMDPQVYSILVEVSHELIDMLPAQYRDDYAFRNAQRIFGPAIGFE